MKYFIFAIFLFSLAAPLAASGQGSDTCFQLYLAAYKLDSVSQREFIDSQQAIIEYNAGKAALVSCPTDTNWLWGLNAMGGAIDRLRLIDSSFSVQYRQWLLSALYWNTNDPNYFCAFLRDIGITYITYTDTSRIAQNVGYNDDLAVIRWMEEHSSCYDPKTLYFDFQGIREAQATAWGGTDTSTGFDTTLPSMHELGLDTLLERHSQANVDEQPASALSILSNATASPNPVSTGTIISFGISKEAYVKIEVFDILGNEVSSAGFESLFEPGNKAVPISLQGLPSGTYFARILTAYGEVQTVKLVKE